MAFNTKGITIDINGDASGFDQELRKIKQEVQGVDHEMSKLSRSMKMNGTSAQTFGAYQTLAKEKLANLQKQMVLNRQTMYQVNEQYQASVQATGEFSAESLSLKQKLQYLEAEAALLSDEMCKLSSSILNCSPAMQNLYVHLNNIADISERAYQTLKPISMLSFAALAGATATAISFEDAWAGVLKTVEGSDQELKQVNDGLKDLTLNTASSYEEIAHFAELGGQMGVATNEIVNFTKVVTMLNDTTNLLGDEAAQSIAQFANVMVDSSQRGMDYYERLGSAIVDLGNNFAATEDDIMQMATRLAVAGRQVGMSSQEVLALSTALSSMGIKAAAGGSSISKLMKEIQVAVSTGSEDLQSYAETAQMSADEFAKAWRDDAGQAFAKFLEGIGKSEDVTAKLDELGITEVRMANAAGALAQSTDIFNSALARSNLAWSENTALTTEAQKRYDTVKSSISQTKEAVRQAANELGSTLSPVVKDVAEGIKDLAINFVNLDDNSKRTVTSLLVAGTSLAPIAKLTSKAAGGAAKLIKVFSQVGSAASTMIKGTTGAASVVGTFGTAIAGLTTPTGLVTAGIIALGTALVGLNTYFKLNHEAMIEDIKAKDEVYQINEELINQANQHAKAAQNHTSAAQETVESYETLKAQTDGLISSISNLLSKEELSAYEKQMLALYVGRLNELYPELGWSVDEASGKIKNNTGEVIENTDSLKENIKAQEEAAKKKYFSKAMDEGYQAITENQMALDKSTQSIVSMTNKHKELEDQIYSLRDAQEKGTIGFQDAEKQIARLEEQMDLYDQKIQEAQKTSVESSKAIGQSWADMLLAMNQSETGGLDTIGESMKSKFAELEQSAADAGINIPTNLATFMNDNSTLPLEAAQMIGALISFQSAVDQAGLYGGLVDSNLAMSILGSAPTVSAAIDALNNLIDFTTACNQAGVTGQQIAENLNQNILTGIMTGEIPVNDAVQAMLGKIDTSSFSGNYGFPTGQKVPQDVADGINSNSAAPANSMKQVMNQLKAIPGASGIAAAMSAEAKKGADQFKSGINPIESYAKTSASSAGSAWSGSGFSGIVGSMANAAASAFQQGIASIPGIAKTAYQDTKVWVDKIQAMSQQSFSVSVTKNIKEVVSRTEKPEKAAPRRMAAFAMPASLDANVVAYASRAQSPVATAVQGAMGYASASMSNAIDTRFSDLEKKMDSLIKTMNTGRMESYLRTIAANSTKGVYIGEREVGKILAQPVEEANANLAKFKRKIGGNR